MQRLALSILIIALTTGCAVGPDYKRPVTETPPAWRVEYSYAAEVANTRWWQQFDDPALNQLIEIALRENKDLAIAAARVDRFLGVLTTTRGQFFPQVGYGFDASSNRAS
jgi:multidrug efflux system outer membrane protein